MLSSTYRSFQNENGDAQSIGPFTQLMMFGNYNDIDYVIMM